MPLIIWNKCGINKKLNDSVRIHAWHSENAKDYLLGTKARYSIMKTIILKYKVSLRFNSRSKWELFIIILFLSSHSTWNWEAWNRINNFRLPNLLGRQPASLKKQNRFLCFELTLLLNLVCSSCLEHPSFTATNGKKASCLGSVKYTAQWWIFQVKANLQWHSCTAIFLATAEAQGSQRVVVTSVKIYQAMSV